MTSTKTKIYCRVKYSCPPFFGNVLGQIPHICKKRQHPPSKGLSCLLCKHGRRKNYSFHPNAHFSSWQNMGRRIFAEYCPYFSIVITTPDSLDSKPPLSHTFITGNISGLFKETSHGESKDANSPAKPSPIHRHNHPTDVPDVSLDCLCFWLVPYLRNFVNNFFGFVKRKTIIYIFSCYRCSKLGTWVLLWISVF